MTSLEKLIASKLKGLNKTLSIAESCTGGSICSKIVEGNLGSVKFRKEASVCKYIVPKGYGSNPSKDTTLVVDDGSKFANGDYILIGQEIMKVTGVSTNDLTVSTTICCSSFNPNCMLNPLVL